MVRRLVTDSEQMRELEMLVSALVEQLPFPSKGVSVRESVSVKLEMLSEQPILYYRKIHQ